MNNNNFTNIVYTRLSSSNQSSFNGIYTSIESQVNKCNEYCLNNNIKNVQYRSEIISGKNINKQYELLSVLEVNNLKNIIFYNVSRFSRNSIGALNFLDKCKSKGIKLHFVEENIVTGHIMDDHRLRMALSDSQLEHERIKERAKLSISIRKEKGWDFGNAEFGNSINFKNGIRKKTKNSYENNIIKFIVTARETVICNTLNKQLLKINPKNTTPIKFYDVDGNEISRFDKPYTLTYQEIADLLNDYGIKKRNKEWSSNMVQYVYNMEKKKFVKNLKKLKINI